MNELAAVLAGKMKLSRRDAQQYIAAFVETIKEGIDKDGLVKIKGLGTFKVIDIDARESVNVNTGERVLISGHQRLSFTPDALMKDLVNKPFSQFETVILNEGVAFPDIESPSDSNEDEPSDETADEASENPQVEQPVEEPKKEEPVEEPQKKQPVEEPQKEEPQAEEQQTVEPLAEIPATEEILAIEESVPEEKSRWWLWLLLVLLACAFCFFVGYWLGQRSHQVAPVDASEPAIAATDTLRDTATQQHDTLSTAVITQADAQAEPSAETSVSEQLAADEPEWRKYEALDERVRHGAYGIVGIDTVIKAKEGETLKRLSKRILGPDMECYVEVYNGMKASDVLTAGQEIKIPKLVTKKRLLKKNNQ